MVNMCGRMVIVIWANGVMTYECCGERYEGEWENDKREGNGVLYFGTCGLESFIGARGLMIKK